MPEFAEIQSIRVFSRLFCDALGLFLAFTSFNFGWFALSSSRNSNVSINAGTGMAEVLLVAPSSCSRVLTTNALGTIPISLSYAFTY